MEISIRELIPEDHHEDLEILVPAYLEIWNHPDNLRFLSFTGQVFEDAQLREWCGAHKAAGIRYFGAFSHDFHLLALLLTRQSAIEGFEFLSIGVAPGEKRRGIGRRLVRFGLDVAVDDRYRAVDCQVYATNAPMLCLLLGESFVPVRMEHRKGPEGEDLVHLKKLLG